MQESRMEPYLGVLGASKRSSATAEHRERCIVSSLPPISVRIPRTCAFPATSRRKPQCDSPQSHRAPRARICGHRARPPPVRSNACGDAPGLGPRSVSEPLADSGRDAVGNAKTDSLRNGSNGAPTKMVPFGLNARRTPRVGSASSTSSASSASRPSSTSEMASDSKVAEASKSNAIAKECLEGGAQAKKTVRQMTTVELMTNPRGPVLDYSFLQIEGIHELRSVAPRSGYREKPPDTLETRDKHGQLHVVANPLVSSWVPPPQGPGGQRLVTQGLKLSNNQLSSLPAATHIILQEVMGRSWLLRWIDLSFNQLEEIPEVLASYQRLNTLYLHANRIRSAAQTKCLQRLNDLHSLTLHGNPCEDSKLYKKVVLVHCAALRKLDFGTVTKQDRVGAAVFGASLAAAKLRQKDPAQVEVVVAPAEQQPAGSRGLPTQAAYEASVALAQATELESLHGVHAGPHN